MALEELASRQQAAMANLKQTASAFDTLLEETITAVDECITQSKKMTDEVKNQASEKAAAVLAEAQGQAQSMISAADREGKTQAQAAMRKIGGLIETARSSAGRIARPDWEQQPLLTGEIWAALQASTGVSFQSLLKDLQNLDEQTIPKDQEPQTTSIEARPDGRWQRGAVLLKQASGIRLARPRHHALPITPCLAI